MMSFEQLEGNPVPGKLSQYLSRLLDALVQQEKALSARKAADSNYWSAECLKINNKITRLYSDSAALVGPHSPDHLQSLRESLKPKAEECYRQYQKNLRLLEEISTYYQQLEQLMNSSTQQRYQSSVDKRAGKIRRLGYSGHV